jgi:hypothetical protein
MTSRVDGWSRHGCVVHVVVFLGINHSLIYVEVLRVTDVVQLNGVVYPTSRLQFSHRSDNEQFFALITASRLSDGNQRNLNRQRLAPGTASVRQADRWDHRMTP